MSKWESCSCLASAMKGNPGLSEHKAGPPCAVDAQPALSVSLSCAEPRASRAASPPGLWGFLLPPCLPGHCWRAAVPLLLLQLGSHQPTWPTPETVPSKARLRLKTKQPRLGFCLLPCTLHCRHTPLMLTQSRETLTAFAPYSGLMHQERLQLWGEA